MHVKWYAPTYYQCTQSWRWCMWNDVLSLIISVCNHEVERMKKFLSNLHNLLFCFPWIILSQFLLAQHEISFYFGFSFFDFLWFFFEQSATTSLGISFFIIALFCFFESKCVSTLTCFPPCWFKWGKLCMLFWGTL